MYTNLQDMKMSNDIINYNEKSETQVFLSSVRCERKFSLTLYLKSTYIKNDKNNILKSSVAIKDSPDKLD